MNIEPIISKMALFGHPLHPVLIHFPVAALIALIATDLAYVATGDFFWARAGLWLAGVGAAGGWVSGVVGMIDLLTVAGIRRLVTAWSHAILAVMLLALASCNWLLRIGSVDAYAAEQDAATQYAAQYIVPWGISVSILTGLLIAITGYLGGRLVYEHAVGVDTE